MYISYDGIVFDMVKLDNWMMTVESSDDGCDFLRYHHVIDVTVMVNPAINSANSFPNLGLQQGLTLNKQLNDLWLRPTDRNAKAATYEVFDSPIVGAGQQIAEALNATNRYNQDNLTPGVAPIVLPETVGMPPGAVMPPPQGSANRYPPWLGIYPGIDFIPSLMALEGTRVITATSVQAHRPPVTNEVIVDTTQDMRSPARRTPAYPRNTPEANPPGNRYVTQLKPVQANSPTAKLLSQLPPPQKVPLSPDKEPFSLTGLAKRAWDGLLSKVIVNPRISAILIPTPVGALVGTTNKATEGISAVIPYSTSAKDIFDKALDKVIIPIGEYIADRVIDNVPPLKAAKNISDSYKNISKILDKLGELFEKLSDFAFLPQDYTPAPRIPPNFKWEIVPPKRKINDPPPPSNLAPNNFGVNATFPITINELRIRLARKRRTLALWLNSGENGQPQYMLYQPFPGAVVDALHGPTCEILASPDVVGNVTGILKLRFECWEAPLNGYTSSQMASANLNPELIGRLLAAASPIISNRWEMSQVPDPNTYLNTTVIKGKAVFRMDVLKSRKWTADQLRPFIMPPIPFGYIRTPPQVALLPGGDAVEYTVTDSQQMLNNPAGMRWGVHSVTANQQMDYNSPIDLVKTAFGPLGSAGLGGGILDQLKDLIGRKLSPL